MIAVRSTPGVPSTCTSITFPIPTRMKISTFLQIPLKPTALESFLSLIAQSTPVM